MAVEDKNFDIDRFTKDFDFKGVREWTVAGTPAPNGFTLEWEFVFEDKHAVLAANANPALESKLSERHRILLGKSKSILQNLIHPFMNDYDIEAAIHDYFCNTYRFDSATAKMKKITDDTPFTAYGAMVNGLAVCQGLTEAASILLSMAGVENMYAESETHMWLLVKLGGGWYHMDITWDLCDTEQIGWAQHNYLNLTDAQMTRYSEHKILKSLKLPKADATHYHHLSWYGFVAQNATDIKTLVEKAWEAGMPCISIWITNHRSKKYDWERDLAFINGLTGSKGTVEKFTYVPPGRDRDTLTIVFNR
jgi:hypothetical protein